MIIQITDINDKRSISRTILEALPEWFEVEESREQYIREAAGRIMLAYKDGDRYVGFLCLKETGKDTVEIAVMGVLKEYHRHGIGRMLVNAARQTATAGGYSFMQVKTVRMGMYDDYDRTNAFYISCGFKEFEVIPDLWDEANPCQIYVMALG
ncbi:Ribosomal protein S18 acetylase RimI [Ruminococcaceae bacterium YRB3002]|nr:Ribosomal protein S18 acetylase RimI [Ruminococcaceae bacterium YRB3002]